MHDSVEPDRLGANHIRGSDSFRFRDKRLTDISIVAVDERDSAIALRVAMWVDIRHRGRY